MFRSTAQTEPTLIDRYQHYRTRRFLNHERTYANALPGGAHSPSAGSWWLAWRSRSLSCSG